MKTSIRLLVSNFMRERNEVFYSSDLSRRLCLPEDSVRKTLVWLRKTGQIITVETRNSRGEDGGNQLFGCKHVAHINRREKTDNNPFDWRNYRCSIDWRTL